MKAVKEERSNSFFIKGLVILWDLLGSEKLRIVKIIILALILESIALTTPFILKMVVDVLPEVIEGKLNNHFLFLLFLMALVTILGVVLRCKVYNPMFYISLIRLENWWPVIAQEKMLALHQGYHETENTGKKAAKINKGCDKLVTLVDNMLNGMLPQTFYLLINFVIMLTISPVLTLVFFAPFIPVAIAIKHIYDEKVVWWDKWSGMNEKSNGFLCQSILNISTVQGFVQEQKEENQMKELRSSMCKLDIDIHLSIEKKMFFIELVLQGTFIVALFVAIWFSVMGNIGIGALAYLIATGTTSRLCLRNIIQNYSQVMKNMVEVYRMKDLLNENVHVQNNIAENRNEGEYAGEFNFNNVGFHYGNKNKPVLDGLNLNIKQGEMTAIIGRSGEGKSTIIRLLSRVYDVSEGSIMLDGKDIRQLNRDWYRGLFATVQQDVDIFDCSLRENITYARPCASEKQVLEAIDAAHLACVIENSGRFPEGLDTQVGERGVRLSGGERQRVGIARAYLALLCGAKVLILDEATSSLDSEAERAIQEMIGKLRSQMNISIVVIAHRLSTIEKADKICVIGGGKVIEEGDHERLVARNGLYARLVKLQQIGELRK